MRLTKLSGSYDLAFVGSGANALDQPQNGPFDAVVTELRLSVINGAQSLNEVMDRQATMKCFGTAHQFLSKPADAPTLASAFARAFAYETWLPGEKVSKLLAQLSKLPSPPRLYFQVVKELRSPDVSLENIGAMISKDPAITAEILQRVNSVLFGLSRTVANLSEAALFPGVDTTRSVILLPHSFSCFDQISTADFSIDPLWQHSIRTGNFARWIAGTEDANKALGDESYTAGMLHDIGKLVPAANVPDQFSEAAMMARSRAGAVCARRRRLSWRPATQNWAPACRRLGGFP